MKIREKKFQHNRKEICKICEKEIDTELDFWAVIIDYEGNKKYGINFYHRDCLKDLIKGKVKIIESKWKKQMSEMVGGILSRLKEGGVIPV